MRYAKALPGRADLVVNLIGGGLEESVVLPDAKAPASYVTELVLPTGVSARATSAAVELLDGKGATVARVGDGLAYDAARPRREAPVAADVVATNGRVVRVRFSIAAAWLADPTRVFPVVIDPFATAGASTDTWVQAGVGPQGTGTELRIGTRDGGATVARTLMRLTDFSALYEANPDAPLPSVGSIGRAILSLYNTESASCTPRRVDAYVLLRPGGTLPWGAGATWNDQPPTDGYGPAAAASFANGGGAACEPRRVEIDVTAAMQRGGYSTLYEGIELRASDEADDGAWKVFSSSRGANPPTLAITYDPYSRYGGLPYSVVSPVDGATLATTTPLLAVGGAFSRVWFRIGSGRDAQSGTVVNSGWITPDQFRRVSWTVPPGVLQDGVSYSWQALLEPVTPGMAPYPPSWSSRFSVDLRTGARESNPFDEAGPVKVNLSNGNALVGLSSPRFPTVGGDVGVGFSFNSQAPEPAGLTGAYYSDPDGDRSVGLLQQPALVRRDPQLSFDWGVQSPAPGVLAPEGFLATWKGFVSVPTSGSYLFGAAVDDGVRIRVDGQLVLDRWVDQAAGDRLFGSAVSLTANVAVSVAIEYYNNQSPASIALWVKGAVAEQPVPATWLSASAPPLSPGWSLVAGAAALSYTWASIADGAAVLHTRSGATRSFAFTSGGYSSPPGEDGVLARDADGRLSLHGADGILYVFDAEGNLASATSALDHRRPAAPTYAWSGSPARLRAITDPVSGRTIDLRYGADPNCPQPPPGFDPQPPGSALCLVSYWDGTSTKVFYVAGQLGRIEDPGSAVSDFAYTAGRLTTIRAPVAADAIAAGVRADDGTTNTTIAYDSAGRAVSVTMPSPSAGALRPLHSYAYEVTPPYEHPSAIRYTDVHVAGQPEPNGYARRVGFDQQGRLLTDDDALANRTIRTWEAERLTSLVPPAGLTTNWAYDQAGRLSSRTGVDAATFVYDEAMVGLGATYWSNPSMAGVPYAQALGIGPPGGAVSADWGTTGVPVRDWHRPTGRSGSPAS